MPYATRPTRTSLPLLLLGALLSSVSGCIPFVPDQQTARLLPPGDGEITPSFSYVSFSVEGETEHIQDHFGLRGGYGLTEDFELRAAYERITFPESDEGVNVFGGGLKWSLSPDRMALFVPVGFITGSGVDTGESWTVAPTLLGTFRASPNVEVVPSAKAIYPFAWENPELFLGFHLGLGLSTDLDRWALRPELGAVFNPGDEGVSWGWTVGLTFRP